jgi:hypothetical protein
MQIPIFTRILGIMDRPEKDSLETNATFLSYITPANILQYQISNVVILQLTKLQVD